MSGILCKVTKNFDDFRLEQIIEVEEKDIRRYERRGRVKRIPDTGVNRSGVGAIPPNPTHDLPGQAPPTQRLQFVDNRRKKEPQIVFRSKRMRPTSTPTIEAPEDNAERIPAARPVGPDLAIPVGPDLSKFTPDVEMIQQNSFWWHVLVNGIPVKGAKNRPRNFRKADAEKAVARLAEGKEV